MKTRKTRTATCIAKLECGRICGLPAGHIDPDRGGMVCSAHAPQAPDYTTPRPGWDPKTGFAADDIAKTANRPAMGNR